MALSGQTPDGASKPINWTAIVPLGLFAALAAGFLYALFNGDPSHLPSVLVGKPAPKFELAGIDGLMAKGAPVPGLSTADLGHGKVAIVNVWASWCKECRDEHPLLNTLSARLNVPLFGIDQNDAPDDAARYLQTLGLPFEKVGADRNGRVSIDWGVYGVPETYVVDRAGKITYKIVGPLSEESIAKELAPAVARAESAGS